MKVLRNARYRAARAAKNKASWRKKSSNSDRFKLLTPCCVRPLLNYRWNRFEFGSEHSGEHYCNYLLSATESVLQFPELNNHTINPCEALHCDWSMDLHREFSQRWCNWFFEACESESVSAKSSPSFHPLTRPPDRLRVWTNQTLWSVLFRVAL